jgi:putative restriction endonuclease
VEVLQNLLARLPLRHRTALEWFHRYAGTEQPWPGKLETSEGFTFLATRAKGIYKPAWSEYALSARQVLKFRYPDKGPVFRDDSTWTYGYFQENDNLRERDSEYANRGLLKCWQDQVPIGVIRQTRLKPDVRYQVIGLALVAGWDEGYFFFEGFGRNDLAHPPSAGTEIELLATQQERSAVESRAFDANSVVGAREKILAQIVRRRGQQDFRAKLLAAYGRRCAITGCDAVEALEAAHIIPYLGLETNNIQNGLLLRADIHTLFDLGLIAVEVEEMTVVIAERLRLTAYREIAGVRLREPMNKALGPSLTALRRHLDWAGLR